MRGVFYSQSGDFLHWHTHLSARLPNLDLEDHQRTMDPEAVDYALVWNAPTGFYQQYPNLRAVLSMAAGVDHILSDPSLPDSVPVLRLTDAGMADQIAEYVALGALVHIRGMLGYLDQQRRQIWQSNENRQAQATTVGILGPGALGRRAAERLIALGFHVLGWARQPRLASFEVHTGPGGFERVVEQSHILVCLLPLTNETRGVLNARVFERMPPNGFLINCARGAHLVLDDLRSALDSGQLQGALLDVFPEEPLPDGHWLWSHPQVMITPHVAARTMVDDACRQIADNLVNLAMGHNLTGQVERTKGY